MGLQHQTCSTDVNSGSVLKCYECGLKKKKKKGKKKGRSFVLAACVFFFCFVLFIIIFVLVFHQSAPYSVLIQAPLLKLLQWTPVFTDNFIEMASLDPAHSVDNCIQTTDHHRATGNNLTFQLLRLFSLKTPPAPATVREHRNTLIASCFPICQFISAAGSN